MDITKEELLKLAELSALQLDEREIPQLIKQIKDVLSYAQSIKNLTHNVVATEDKQAIVNQTREDIVGQCQAEAVLAQAPEKAENFFVVPRILEGN